MNRSRKLALLKLGLCLALALPAIGCGGTPSEVDTAETIRNEPPQPKTAPTPTPAPAPASTPEAPPAREAVPKG